MIKSALKSIVIIPLFAAVILTLPGLSAAELVKLKNGDVITAESVTQEGDSITIQSKALGTIVLPSEAVDSILSGDTTEPQCPECEPCEPCPSEKAKPKPSPLDNKFETGATGTTGNSETFDYRAAINSIYKTDEFKIKFDAAYFYGSNIDTISRNQYTFGEITDVYFYGGRLSWFIGGRYDWNQFESYYARWSAKTGIGYKPVDNGRTELVFRAGAGAIREYGSENDEIRPEGLFGGEWSWKILDGQKFYADSYYYPDFSTAGEYRVLSNASYTANLAGADGVAINLGVENEYNSNVEPEYEYNDLKYYGSIVVDF